MSLEVKYFQLSDINLYFKVKICSLKGRSLIDELAQKALANYSPVTHSRDVELFVVCQIFSNGSPIGLPVFTTYRSFPHQIRWDEWLTFPVKYRDLPLTSRLVFTVYDVTPSYAGSILAQSTLPSSSALPAPPRPPSPSSSYAATMASSLSSLSSYTSLMLSGLWNNDPHQPIVLGGTCFTLFDKKGFLKLGKRKLYLWPGARGDGSVVTSTPSKLKKKEHNLRKGEQMDKIDKLMAKHEQKKLPTVKWLDKLTFRRIKNLQEKEENLMKKPSVQEQMYLTIEFPSFKHQIVYHQRVYSSLPEIHPFRDKNRVFVLYDPEIALNNNPVENKFNKLAKHSEGLHDRNLKPKPEERKRIQNIINSPNRHMNGEEKLLLWKYRFTLRDDKKALTKFLRCVDWNDVNETKKALELMEEWTPIDIADALELLSSYFLNKEVRAYGVKQLQRADNEELGDYLLQLVQALRYESHYPSFLSEFLIERATQTMNLANFFHWYLTVEKHDKQKGQLFARLHNDFMEALRKSETSRGWEIFINAQAQLIKDMQELCENAKSGKGKVDKKVERLRWLLTEEGDLKRLREFPEAIRMPVRPEVLVKGMVGEESTMFKSALAPLLACFTTVSETGEVQEGKYKVIFKSGDDLRQDQLMIQMINLMDSILKKVKLDLKLTPYRVLATGPQQGFCEYVQKSYTLTSILEQYEKDITKFFSEKNKLSQLHSVVDTFVKSCAGYCVITYILGIGDRHLDNVLLTTDGHLFHIDFGFIFGRDPKPFPPPMKFCKEMVLAMGGETSPNYLDFRKYCCLAFNLLRPHANLILNLLSLMGDANIPDLARDVEKNLMKVQEKFRLDLSDEEAEHFVLSLIDDSVSALFPKFMDTVHQWALYWK